MDLTILPRHIGKYHKLSPEGEAGYHTVSVQCNSDEIVTGGGFNADLENGQAHVVETSKKQKNGWTTTWYKEGGTITVFTECLKVVPANAAGE
jgi:hypothetical protein